MQRRSSSEVTCALLRWHVTVRSRASLSRNLGQPSRPTAGPPPASSVSTRNLPSFGSSFGVLLILRSSFGTQSCSRILIAPPYACNASLAR
eukprot:2943949-Rhodomonas_salina.1